MSSVLVRPILWGAVVGFGVATLLLVGLLAYRTANYDKIFPGVTIGHQPVGGMTIAQAREAVAASLGPSLAEPLTVSAGGREWQLSREALGARYDVDQLAEAAFQVGRQGPASSQLIGPLLLRVNPRDLEAGIDLGATDRSESLQPIAASVDRPAVDARLVVSADHTVSIVPDRSGARLDLGAAQTMIAAALVAGSTQALQLPVTEVAPAVRAADLTSARDQARVLLSGPVDVTYDGQTWELTTGEIQAGLILPGVDNVPASAAPGVDPRVASQLVDRIAASVDRPARDAALAFDGERVSLRGAQTARRVSTDATVARVIAALSSSVRTIEPIVDESNPEVVDADLQAALGLANSLIGAPVTINGPDGDHWTLSPAALRKMLILPDSPTLQRDRPPKLDPAKLTAFVGDVANRVDATPFNARFELSGAGARLLREGIPGRRVDQGNAVDLIAAAAAGANRTVALPVDAIQPSITSADADQIAALHLLIDNSTSYVGSIPPRRHNVEFATSLLNGVVVAPGEIFSFDHELGPTTLARGFQVGFGIVAQGDAVKTVPSVAGGICQVATTLFQPVFWEGYTIEERYWHLYWIDHYRSRGLVGLDTTVDPDSGLDFQFKNDTSSPIVIQSSADGSNVHFALYGTSPGWTVQVDPPVITNVIKTDRTLQVQYDPTMPKGQQITTEAAQDGFTASVRRTVTDAAGHVRVLNLRSTYAPAHNVVLVGTK